MADWGEIGQGLGEALSGSLGNIQREAQAIREQPQKDLTLAISQEALNKAKAENAEIARKNTVVDLSGADELKKIAYQKYAQKGWIKDPNQVTVGEQEDILVNPKKLPSNPEIWHESATEALKQITPTYVATKALADAHNNKLSNFINSKRQEIANDLGAPLNDEYLDQAVRIKYGDQIAKMEAEGQKYTAQLAPLEEKRKRYEQLVNDSYNMVFYKQGESLSGDDKHLFNAYVEQSQKNGLQPNWTEYEDYVTQKKIERNIPKENTGIWNDSGFFSNGQPVLRNSRSGDYKVGESITKDLPNNAISKTGTPAKEEESMVGSVKSLDMFKDVKDTMKQISTGIPKVGSAKVAIKRYMSNEDAIKFNTARDNLKNLAQEIIKGIPSNFDVENFIATLPNADYTYAENVTRVQKAEDLIKRSLRSKIQALQNKRAPIPEEILNAAIQYNVFGNKEKKTEKANNSDPLGIR